MPQVHRNFVGVCAAITLTAPLCALAEGVVIGDGRVKTDAGEFVTKAGRSWACLGAEWQDAGTVPGGRGTRYSCPGTLLDAGTYTAVSAGRTAVALADINAELDGVAVNVARNAESTEALRTWIETQVENSHKLLYETIAARFDAIPARLLANKDFGDAIAKLRRDILTAVQATGTPPSSGR
jgi:hypothetical protein